jgi:uncharacterized protein involved in exopolysaccharide biosynthesis
MEEREPELIDYLAVLWRWKWLVVGGTLAGLLVAGLLTWSQPRMYRVGATIETGDVVEPEVERLVTRLNLGSFAESDEGPKASMQDRGRLVAEYRKPLVVQLSLETAAPAAGAERVERAAGRAIEELNRLLTVQNAETEAGLSGVRAEIERLQGVRTLRERRAEALRRSVERLQKVRADVSRRVDDAATALVFTRLSDEMGTQEYMLAEVERELTTDLPLKLQDLGRQAEAVTRKMAAIRRPRLVAPPEIPATPVRPRAKLNAAVGFAAGLLGSVLLALFAEYVRVQRARRSGWAP